MTYKFQRNQAIMSGGLDQEGSIQIMDQSGDKQLKLNDDGTLSGSALATLHSIASGQGNFTVSSLGAVVGASLNNSSGGITAAGAIAGVTTFAASGDVSSSAAGEFLSLDINGAAAISSAGALSGVTTIAASGLSSLASISIDNGSTFGPDDVADLWTYSSAGDTTQKDGTYDFDIASHDGTNGLKLGGTLVVASATELDYTNVAAIGSAEGSKALVLDANKSISGIKQLAATGLSGALQYKYKPEANGGISADTFQNNADVVNLKLTGSALATEAVNVAANSLLNYNSVGVAKSMTIVSLAAAMAGAGITATNGVFSADSAGQPTPLVDGQACVEGINYANADLTALLSTTLPAAPTVGDTVTVKAKGLSGNGVITISKAGSHTIDGETSVSIESTYGSITFVYAIANDWRII